MVRDHLKAGVEEKFTIPLRSRTRSPSAKNRRVSDFAQVSAEILGRRTNAINRELVRSRVVYDTTLADLFPARFELWLDQDDRLERAPRGSFDGGDNCRQHQRGGDKRHIHGYKADARTQI